MISDPALSSRPAPGPRGRLAPTPPRGYALLVEGDRDLREGLAELLRLEGFGVVGVEGGLDALLQLFTGEPLPDVVVYDDDGPGMSGVEFRRLLRRNASAAGIPVLVLGSAPATGESAEDAKDRLEKPCRPETLIAAVAAAARTRRS